MISKHEILKMVQAIHRHDRGLPARRLIYPAREWGIGVVLTVLLLVAACVGTGYTYLSLNNIENTIATPAVQTVRYDTTTADRARELYQARTATFDTVTETSVISPPVPEVATSSTSSTESLVEPVPVATSTEPIAPTGTPVAS